MQKTLLGKGGEQGQQSSITWAAKRAPVNRVGCHGGAQDEAWLRRGKLRKSIYMRQCNMERARRADVCDAERCTVILAIHARI
eukprot:1158790-Pelagomonas_calceolata.AAC.9